MNRFQCRYCGVQSDIIRDATLRDQFAMAALTGLCAFNDQIDGKTVAGPTDHAKLAYKYADAMLKQREEGRE
jgi:hypothetical protein